MGRGVNMTELEVGDKVRITDTIGLFPDAIIDEGETGKIVEHNDHGNPLFLVKLDTHHEGLENWDNNLQIRKGKHPSEELLERVEA